MAKLCVTPFRIPSLPVSSEARDGEQVEAAEWKSTNLNPLEAIFSRFGVVAVSEAIFAPRSPHPISSAKMMIMLGFL